MGSLITSIRFWFESVRKGSRKSANLVQNLNSKLLLSFDTVRDLTFEDVNRIHNQARRDENEIDKLSTHLEMFIVLCGYWLDSPEINEESRKKIEASQREVRILYITLIKQRNIGNYAWSALPLPKSYEKSRVEKWVKAKLPGSTENDYFELSDVARKNLISFESLKKNSMPDQSQTFGWVSTPLFGVIEQ
jgi:hypothetical protein